MRKLKRDLSGREEIELFGAAILMLLALGMAFPFLILQAAFAFGVFASWRIVRRFVGRDDPSNANPPPDAP
jgi:hypothetical protein